MYLCMLVVLITRLVYGFILEDGRGRVRGCPLVLVCTPRQATCRVMKSADHAAGTRLLEDGRGRVRECGRVGSGVGLEGGQRDGVGGWAHITPSPDQSHKNVRLPSKLHFPRFYSR